MEDITERCIAAADDLAEEKKHIIQLEVGEDLSTVATVIVWTLSEKYGFSFKNAKELTDEFLSVSLPQDTSNWSYE